MSTTGPSCHCMLRQPAMCEMHLHDTEGLSTRGVHGQRRHGDVRARLPVLLHERPVVHPVQVVACIRFTRLFLAKKQAMNLSAASQQQCHRMVVGAALAHCHSDWAPRAAAVQPAISPSKQSKFSYQISNRDPPERIKKSSTPVRVVLSNSQRYCRTASAVPCTCAQRAAGCQDLAAGVEVGVRKLPCSPRAGECSPLVPFHQIAILCRTWNHFVEMGLCVAASTSTKPSLL